MARPTRTYIPFDRHYSPCTPEVFFNANDFTNQTESHDHALDTILSTTDHQEIIYTNVPTPWGESVVSFLDEQAESSCGRKHYNSVTQIFWIRVFTTTEIHSCHQEWVSHEQFRWMDSGLCTLEEVLHLNHRTGTTIYSFHSPYTGSRKEPDLFIRPGNQRLPSVVIESGWGESMPRLHDDMRLWLVGGNGVVKAVIIIEWHRVAADKVGGKVEVYTLDGDDAPILRQEEIIFPPPLQREHIQRIALTRGMLFGDTIPQGRKPDDVLSLSLDDLRREARDALDLMRLCPAE
ncbi:hypothetical protein ASPWEDRAFT_172174 [Aspergillus wentii DTO 134E9]|uniref:Restriction endonuclease domain-containing protein n=1 Tax=Aspergillus wentii DTO 134E9 TaxID=1073089 RepID=A0A1L9RKA2_ASPWE|nr:uncharacterized protein ASPWEDRAFT_172174 [Aspergillus wentii DTO 134E9]KAI9924864.1 hypothetical protein MW887_006721 [Aspergillus wentii]OJJ35362.1 hypothetical protein ASPWEDRAFT_172174 [Aspergillus wentii DTO 134E9]